ncbi:hypothetical protein [Thiobacillus denitrificans]|jgi:hypothetical protein|uniref:hypothetical protein n=1 Tax=Thiobacillus denitrificans TaxID=36861 RepID=UPI000372411F|nr:hypothetical protein [Thiobacillus denitrificans]
MASISRIQVANFLTDGYMAGKEWTPLYRGETFRLFGQPTAMQIDNGGGKTSLTEACLYLLSRDRRLKPKVEDRIAPIDRGWTHIRIEFIEKSHDDDVLQVNLITQDPEDIPGITYVMGMCWSRTKEPFFYSYQGSLDDAPCFTQDPKGLTLIANDDFRKSIERMPGAKWNRWRNQSEWLDEIKQFTNVDVIKQNVEFQLEGAGDYSAMVTKVKPEGGETYDAAFFRQFVAPELLKHAMGAEGDPDEQGFEDTILKTLKPAADALLDINRRQNELDDTRQALLKFDPVLQKAGEVVSANTEYDRVMNDLARNAAIVHSLALAAPLPGMPVVPAGTQWASDKRIMEALAHMVIDKKHGALITDEGLSCLTRIPTGEINRRATAGAGIAVGSQLIDIKDHLKTSNGFSSSSADIADESQAIENKDHLKKGGRGGRRYETKFYDLEQARSIVSASANLSGAQTNGLADVLSRAFGITTGEIDTNPYRARLRVLAAELKVQKTRQATAKSDYTHYQEEHERLTAENRETKENQIAYETFASRKGEFPEEFWGSPIAALSWAKDESSRAGNEHTEHIKRSGECQAGYSAWKALTAAHGLTPLTEAHDALVRQHADATNTDQSARLALGNAKAELRKKQTEQKTEEEKFKGAEQRLNRLNELAASLPAFRDFFGDADPASLDPNAEMQSQQDARSKNQSLLQSASSKKQELSDLRSKSRLFLEIFGDVDPVLLDPTKDLQNHREALAIEDGTVAEHLPYTEALSYFREQHPGMTPDAWLSETASQRQLLNEERIEKNKAIKDLEGELEDLAAFGAADDRVYAKALQLLGRNGIAFERLHDLASRTVKGPRLEQCLSLFSAALSAPVIASLEAAGEATRLLEEARLTVPIFFKPALEHLLREDEIHQIGEVAHALLVGRHTQQVAILLNPSLIKEERSRTQTQIGTLSKRNETIGKLLADISEESAAVTTAVTAKEATRRDSERKYAEAMDRRDDLQQKTAEFVRRASTEALEAISYMKRFLKAGGNDELRKLAEETIPELEGEKVQIQGRIDKLNRQTSEPAIRALHAAKDYLLEGGETALATAKADVEALRHVVEILKAAVNNLQSQVDGELNQAATNATDALNQLNETFQTDKRDLETAIRFEMDGHVRFMEQSPAREQELDAAVKAAQARLQGIEFDRANRYIQSTRAEERSLAERIAEAQGKRDNAKFDEEKAGKEITQIEGKIGSLTPFMEAMHEMVIAVREQHAKIAVFSEDILRLMQSSSITDPEILGYAETIRIACLGDTPGIDTEIRSAMINLAQCVRELDINTADLQKIDENRKRLFRDYVDRRDGFCDRARKGEIKGLNQLEISTIAEATTIEQLQLIQKTRDKIEVQIGEIESNLDKIREAMETNKHASINSLASFARQAKLSLDILDRVMKQNPKARFHVETPVADEQEIERIIGELLAQIEDKERALRERSAFMLNDEIDRRAADYKQLIHDTIYRRIFSARDKNNNPIQPKVYFTHASIRGMEKVPFTDRGLSTGQRTALAMMWLIKQAEFAIARAASFYSTRKEQKAALKGAQRIMFFDGLFSNLSNEDYINDAFQGLRGVGDNFQLIGLIHNPYYVNNKDIFPVHLVGKKKVANKGDPGRERVFVSVEPWQDSNGVILYTSAYKHKAKMASEEALNA